MGYFKLSIPHCPWTLSPNAYNLLSFDSINVKFIPFEIFFIFETFIYLYIFPSCINFDGCFPLNINIFLFLSYIIELYIFE